MVEREAEREEHWEKKKKKKSIFKWSKFADEITPQLLYRPNLDETVTVANFNLHRIYDTMVLLWELKLMDLLWAGGGGGGGEGGSK